MNDNTRLPWYAVITKPSRESFAKDRLEEQGYVVYSPACIEPDKHGQPIVRPMFPRIMFAQLGAASGFDPIDNTPGVTKLLRWPDRRPQRVAQREIDRVQAMENEAGVVNLIPEPEHLKYESDQQLAIVGGPLDGRLGIYKGLTPKGRVKLLLDLIGEREQEFEPAQVRRA
jgi:hypothetical protein